MNREDYSPLVQQALAAGDRWGVEQHGDELAPFCEVVAELKPRHVLEIGFRRGGTLACWHELSTGHVIGMDLPGDEFNEQRAKELWEAYPRVWCLLADSHRPESLAEVKRRLNGESLDLLFIDGDHSFEGVGLDWLMYSPLVRPGGVVAFHDIQPNPACAVDRFWASLKGQRETTEFNIGGPWGGIGAVRAA